MHVIWMCCFYVSNTSYYVEVENGALLCARSWKMILGGHGKSLKSHGKFLGKKYGNPGHFFSLLQALCQTVCCKMTIKVV